MLQFIAGIQNFFYSLYALLFPMAAGATAIFENQPLERRFRDRALADPELCRADLPPVPLVAQQLAVFGAQHE